MFQDNEVRYDTVARAFHWLMAAIIITLIVVGIYMADLPDDAPGRGTIFMLHKSFGALALLLFFGRIAWRRHKRPPELPAVLQPWERKLAVSAHYLLYLFMFIVPFSGYAMSTFGGYPVSFFGLFRVPAIFPKNETLGGFAHESHEILAYTLIAILALHIAGALKHRFLDGGEADVLKRML
jgi:cytochrome b561